MRISILFILIFIASGFSQNDHAFRFGLKFGGNLSKIVRDQIPESNFNEPYYKLGSTLGIIVLKSLGEKTSLQGELVYRQAGSLWGKNIWGVSDIEYAIYHLSYITVPVYFQFDSRIGNIVDNFDFLVGASYSYNIFARQEMHIESPVELNYGPENIRDEISHQELGVLTGIKLPFYKDRIYFSLQYYWALTGLYSGLTKSYPDELQDKVEFKNRSFTISCEVYIF